MEYTKGSVGRIFTIRFDDGDNFLEELAQLCLQEDIKAAWFNVIGGLREADVVTGPKQPVMPPEPVWQEVRQAKEVVGVGSVFRDEHDAPKIHLHTALGHHGDTMTVCVRKGTKTYLILEVYLIEITDTKITRPWFPEGQFNRLSFG
jgi:hypothetical protein